MMVRATGSPASPLPSPLLLFLLCTRPKKQAIFSFVRLYAWDFWDQLSHARTLKPCLACVTRGVRYAAALCGSPKRSSRFACAFASSLPTRPGPKVCAFAKKCIPTPYLFSPTNPPSRYFTIILLDYQKLAVGLCMPIASDRDQTLPLQSRARAAKLYVGSPHAFFGAPFWHIAHAQGPPSIHPHRQHVPYTMPQQVGPAHRQHGRPQSTRKGKSQLLGLRTRAS